MAQAASNMRCSIDTNDRGNIPVNYYGVSLGTSGLGKGYSINIMVEEVLGGFRKEFLDTVLPFISNYWLEKIATRISRAKSTDFDEELVKVQKEFESLGEYMFSFDSGTTAGVRQLRQQMLMAKIGALSFVADEIGTNLTKQSVIDIIEIFLDLYDVGKVGDKLLLNSVDRKRNKQIFGRTPSNMLLFGTPDKLFDGAVTEKTFRTLLTTGLSRRCFYAYSDKTKKKFKRTAKEIYEESINVLDKGILTQYYDLFKTLADTINYNIKLTIDPEESIFLVQYRRDCEKAAQDFPGIDQEKKAELDHSYFKVLKLAGTYAFIDQSDKVTMRHIRYAITCGLDSSKVFQTKIIDQPQQHVRLLQYLCSKSTPSTFADMARDLAFFPKAQNKRNELFTLAASEGYLSNITISHRVDNDIDLYSAKELEKTDLDEIIVSYSTRISSEYENSVVEFSELYQLVQTDGYHWVNHHLDEQEDGLCNRSEADIILGFNTVVLDLDKNVDIETVRLVLDDYDHLIYVTKRHEKEKHRFRVILPLSHIVELGSKEFAKFMRNVYEWLPFNVDEQTSQRSRKWLSNKDKYWYNEGKELLNAHQFIPHTTKAIALNNYNSKNVNLPQLEKWYLRQVDNGDGRNNTLIKYALVLVDSGLTHNDIMSKVIALNSRFKLPMDEIRIHSTIGITVTKRLVLLDQE
jgi:hypothetical protein